MECDECGEFCMSMEHKSKRVDYDCVIYTTYCKECGKSERIIEDIAEENRFSEYG